MPNDLTTRAAKLLWTKLPRPHTCSGEIDEAARAVVALVLDDVVQAVDNVSSAPCAKCGKPRNDHPFRHPFVSSQIVDIAAAIRALGDKT